MLFVCFNALILGTTKRISKIKIVFDRAVIEECVNYLESRYHH